jgi:WD40 repeat protein
MRQADETLRKSQGTLNELCREFLENSFDHLAKGRPLAVPDYDSHCPFPGLGVFDAIRDEQGQILEDFRPFFFGREKLTEELLRLTTAHRFVAVLGGSGSGKSSLVRAGLLKKMQDERPGLKAIVFPPGRQPLARLETELTRMPQPDILVVDQFEELFTLCTDVEQRTRFLERLLPLRETCFVVITMRAEFLKECAEHDDLHQLLDAEAKHLKILQPLRGNDLRNAMESQANKVKLQFEPGLAARIFEDIENEPGAMPLLQHCLRQLWQLRHGRWLKWTRYEYDEHQANAIPGYRHVGGVKGAIAHTAEEVYHKLSPEQRDLVPFIFERLSRIDTETVEQQQRLDTRRREELAELTPEGNDPRLTKEVVTFLADARLVVTSRNPETEEIEVEVTHEALIRHWARLQGWLDAARQTAHLVDRVRSDTSHYLASDSLADNLTLRGMILEQAEGLLLAKPPRLSENEATFVRLCRKQEAERRDAELAAAQREAEAQKREAEAQKEKADAVAGRSRVLKWIVVISFGLVLSSFIAQRLRKSLIEATYRLGLVNTNVANLYQRTGEFELASVYLEQVAKDLRTWEWYYLKRQLQGGDVITLSGHTDYVNSVSFSPNGSRIVTGSYDNTAKVWDAQTGAPLLNLKGHTDGVTSVAFSPDGERIVTGSYDGTANVWDALNEGPPLLELEGQRFDVEGRRYGITSVAFSPDGASIVIGTSNGSAKVWDSRQHKPPIELLGHTDAVLSVAFHGDGLRIVTGSNDGTAKVWDARTEGPPLLDLQGHTGPVNSVAISPDGARIVTGSDDQTARVWDARTGTPLLDLQGHLSSVTSVAYSPDGARIVTGSNDKTGKVWDAQTGAPLLDLQGHTESVFSVAFSPDGLRIVTGSYDKTAKVWDARTGTKLRQPLGHTMDVSSVAISPDGARIVTGSLDQTAKVWDALNEGPPLLELMGHRSDVTSVAFSPDGLRIVTGSLDGSAKVWDARKRKPPLFELNDHRDGVTSVAFSPDGARIVTGSRDKTAKVWDARNKGAPLLELKGHNEAVTSVAFSHDSSRIVTGSWDQTAKVWDARNKGEPLHTLSGKSGIVLSVVFSPNDALILTGSDTKGQLWDAVTGLLAFELQGRSRSISSVAFSQDGKRIATGGDAFVRVWDSRTGLPVIELQGHTASITSVVFSNDNMRIVSGSKDKTAQVWEIQIR